MSGQQNSTVYLFVNKHSDSRSLSKSHGKAASAILRHVKSRQNKRNDRRNSLSDAARKRPSSTSSEIDALPKCRPPQPRWRKRTTSSSENSDSLTPESESSSGSLLSRTSTIDIPGESGEVQEMLQHFQSLSLLPIRDADERAPQKDVFDEIFSHPEYLSSIVGGVHKYAMLACTAARIGVDVPARRQEFNIKASKYMQCSLQTLQEYLGDPTSRTFTDQQALQELLLLCWTNCYLLDFAAAETHLNVIKGMSWCLDQSQKSDQELTKIIGQCEERIARAKSEAQLYGNNKDPFQAAAIQITSEMNFLLSFMRDEVYPKLCFNGYLSHFVRHSKGKTTILTSDICVTSFPANKHWGLITESLSDECSALACMSTAASYLAAVQPKFGVQAMEFRLQSLSAVRRMLTEAGPNDPSFIQALFWMWNAELRGGEGGFKTASVLSQLLCPLLKSSFEEGTGSMVMLLETMVMENDVATYNLTRNNLDPESWLPQIFHDDWQEAELYLAPYPSTIDDIHQSIEPPLRSHLHHLRWLFYYWDHPFERSAPREQELVLRWFMTRQQWVSACLIDAYVDMMDDSKANQKQTFQALLALAAVNHTRVIGTKTYVGTTDVRDTTQPVVKQIRHLLTTYFGLSALDNQYSDGILWVLYLGSCWEMMAASSSQIAWFLPRLLLHARACNITTWSHCEVILESFFVVHKDVPSGAEWFEKMIEGGISIVFSSSNGIE